MVVNTGCFTTKNFEKYSLQKLFSEIIALIHHALIRKNTYCDTFVLVFRIIAKESTSAIRIK